MRLAILAASLLLASSAFAHNEWTNGAPVPAWVKNACCGPEDVHHLTAEQVRAMKDGWHVDGYPRVLAYGQELPSEDGDYWIFYRINMSGEDVSYSPVYCFFAPPRTF
jgi:hypothetical protein